VLTRPVFLEGFEVVAAIDRQDSKVSCGIQHQKLAASRLLNRLKADYKLIVEDGFSVRVPDGAYRHYGENMTHGVKCQTSCAAATLFAALGRDELDGSEGVREDYRRKSVT
jgi:hypothetical protein